MGIVAVSNIQPYQPMYAKGVIVSLSIHVLEQKKSSSHYLLSVHLLSVHFFDIKGRLCASFLGPFNAQT